MMRSVIVIINKRIYDDDDDDDDIQLFVFGLVPLFAQMRIEYSAHYLAPKQIWSKYSVQP